MTQICYAYDFENPRRLVDPINITKNGTVLITIDDSVQDNF